MSGVAGATAGSADRRRRILGAVAAALLVALAVVLAFVGAGEEDESAGLADLSARIVDPAELSELEDELGYPLYWAGAPAGRRLELRVESGNAYLRYLPPGVAAGDPRQRFLTVGTYPVTDAEAALERTARSAGADLEPGPGGGVVLANPSSAGSAYLAYPGSDLQIEVYDPRPERALQLIREGAIGPVG